MPRLQLRHISAPAATLLAAALLLAGCSGSEPALDQTKHKALPQNLIPPFPQESVIDRVLRHSSTPTDNPVDGSDTFTIFGNGNPSGTSLALTPPQGDIAAAIYQFDPGGNPLLSYDCNISVNGGDAYFGLADFSSGTWQIEGPFTTDPAAVAINDTDFLSPGGFFYFFVLAFDGAQVTHASSVISTDKQVTGPPWKISGTVRDTSAQPVPGVIIHIAFEGLASTTDANGNYQFTGLDNGDYILVPDAAAFAVIDSSLTFVPNVVTVSVLDQDVDQDFEATPITMPAEVTYSEHMKPWLFEPVCMNCHNSSKSGSGRHGAPGTVNWDTYDGTSPIKKESGKDRVKNDTMPASSLGFKTNAYQKELFQKWADGNDKP